MSTSVQNHLYTLNFHNQRGLSYCSQFVDDETAAKRGWLPSGPWLVSGTQELSAGREVLTLGRQPAHTQTQLSPAHTEAQSTQRPRPAHPCSPPRPHDHLDVKTSGCLPYPYYYHINYLTGLHYRLKLSPLSRFLVTWPRLGGRGIYIPYFFKVKV